MTEAAFKLAGEVVVWRKREALCAPPRFVQRDEFTRQLAYRRTGAGLHRAPGLAAQLRQRGCAAIGTDIARHLLEVVVGDVQAVITREHERQVIACDVGHGAGLKSLKPPDSLVLMHDVVAHLEIKE